MKEDGWTQSSANLEFKMSVDVTWVEAVVYNSPPFLQLLNLFAFSSVAFSASCRGDADVFFRAQPGTVTYSNRFDPLCVSAVTATHFQKKLSNTLM